MSQLNYTLDAAPLLDDHPETIFAFTDQHGSVPGNFLYAVKSGQLKYIQANHSKDWYEAGQIKGLAAQDGVTWQQEELYNLTRDPQERHPKPLSAAPAAFINTVEAVQSRYLGEGITWQPYDEVLQDRLKDLGYLDHAD